MSDAMDGGHMNSSSILLEGTKKVSQGRMVRLNLSQVKNYSLFPGQVCICVCVICLCLFVYIDSMGGVYICYVGGL